jgi:Cu-processing system ATP-binding protein
MIEVKNISKRFGKLQALDSIHLSLHSGTCTALTGPNGCGKTTLIKTILGMVLPDSGNLYFEGENVLSHKTYKRDIGYMPQIGRYPENMSIGQIISMIQGIRNHTSDLDLELYEQFNLKDMLHKKMRTLSGGTTQKVSAVLAFMFQPKVLILDEPTAGLDPIASEILKEKIIQTTKQGKLVLITSHVLSELEGLISHMICMQDGRILMHEEVQVLKQKSGKEMLSQAMVKLLKEITPC